MHSALMHAAQGPGRVWAAGRPSAALCTACQYLYAHERLVGVAVCCFRNFAACGMPAVDKLRAARHSSQRACERPLLLPLSTGQCLGHRDCCDLPYRLHAVATIGADGSPDTTVQVPHHRPGSHCGHSSWSSAVLPGHAHQECGQADQIQRQRCSSQEHAQLPSLPRGAPAHHMPCTQGLLRAGSQCSRLSTLRQVAAPGLLLS